MSSFPELRHGQFVRFLEAFCRTGTLNFGIINGLD
jgi:hypothetical protein